MKNTVIILVIGLFLIGGYAVIRSGKKDDLPPVQSPKKTDVTETHSLPTADYSEAINPLEVLPEPEEVEIIDEEH